MKFLNFLTLLAVVTFGAAQQCSKGSNVVDNVGGICPDGLGSGVVNETIPVESPGSVDIAGGKAPKSKPPPKSPKSPKTKDDDSADSSSNASQAVSPTSTSQISDAQSWDSVNGYYYSATLSFWGFTFVGMALLL